MKKPSSQETKIEKVVLTVGGQTVPVTLEQALELRDALNQAFPCPSPNYTPVYIPSPTPFIVERPYIPPQSPMYPIITCGTTQLAYELSVGPV